MNIVTIYKKFPTEQDCIKHIEKIRWNNIPSCPYCFSTKATPMPKENRYHCYDCKTSFSVTVRTIFHNTKLPIQKWFLAISLILNAKKGISSRQLARDLDVNKNTAWRMSMKIRKAMIQSEQKDLLSGIVEVDETYIGGKPRKGKKNNGDKNKRGRGTKKTAVVGMVERQGNVKVKSFYKKSLNGKNLKALVRGSVDVKNTTLMTDEYKGYLGMSKIIKHKFVDHTRWYVDGNVHTNSIEFFWAILKRGIVGQFHKVSVRYLPKYIDEFCYRFNNRKNDNLFELTLQKAMW